MSTGLRTVGLAAALVVGVAVISCDESTMTPTYGSGDAAITVTVSLDGSAGEGVTVKLLSESGSVLRTEQTDAAGEARFTDLSAGTYEVEVTVPTGYEVSGGGQAQRLTQVSQGGEATVSFSLVAQAPLEAADTVVVEAVNFQFTPADLTIAPNTLVRWVNATSTTHTVTPDGHSEWTDTALPGSGDTFEHVFMDPGSFPYYCTPHQSAGMVGSITVQSP